MVNRCSKKNSKPYCSSNHEGFQVIEETFILSVLPFLRYEGKLSKFSVVDDTGPTEGAVVLLLRTEPQAFQWLLQHVLDFRGP
jgi:hypothetical protein